MSGEEIIEDSFSSDEEFDDEVDSDSSTDVEAKLAEEDVFDIEFFKCYSALKKKDDKIYDKSVKFFTNESSSEEENEQEVEKGEDGSSSAVVEKKLSTPKMTLLDHQLNLEHDEIEEPKIDLNKAVTKSYYDKELEEIKKSIEKVGEDIDSESDDDLLVVKGKKTGPSKPRKKIEAILDDLEKDDDVDISHLRQIWSDSDKLAEDEKFLRDYILNKRYMTKNVGDNEIDNRSGFFSKNLDDLSDIEDEEEEENGNKSKVIHHSEESDFDKIARIPRNSTKTIRDLVDKREKKEKRMKKLEKEKQKKKALKDADFEDLVGDLPTKFHYRETEPNDYGLSAEELLVATDEELEKWINLKDAIGYKSMNDEMAQKKKFEQRRHDIELKKKIFKSIYGETANESSAEDPTNVATPPPTTTVEKESNTKKRKKQKKRGISHKKFAKSGVAPDRLLAYGISKTKLKKSKLL